MTKIATRYEVAAAATSAVLAQSATFTRGWYLAQPGMTPCFWRFATKLGMLAKDHVVVEGDVVGAKGGAFLLAAIPAEQGKRHKKAGKGDAGDAYALTPFGRYIYGKKFKALAKEAAAAEDTPEKEGATE